MHYWFLFLLPLLFSPVFAQTSSDVTPSQYVLKFDGHTFDISYVVNGDVLAMDIDPESKSLLIGLENTMDSKFSLIFNPELIRATNNEYVVLVDGQDVDYQFTQDSDGFTLSFFVPAGTQEVEVIGTSVIPEFPIGVIFVLVIMITSVIIFTKTKTSFFKL
ncbi:MAG: PEFG-CTERM sorting domain-containing protein [Nitrosarchaeum sp.]|nr:PEFG-CTERM sorting domain-containing protein [Nitrosarchaeum sp.]